jgi:hypothetical protein
MRTWLALERLNSAARARSGPALWIFDQGLLQCLFSIYPERLTFTEQRRLTQSALTAMRSVLPNVVVVVTVDEQTAARRLRSRPFQQTSYDLASPDLEVQLSRRRHYAEEALPQALSSTRVKVIQVSGYDPPQTNVHRILDALMAMVKVNQVTPTSENSIQPGAL